MKRHADITCNMATVTDFSKAFDVQPNTIRYWSKQYADFLSDDANPGKGETRIYSDDDGRVIAFIAEMRNEGQTFENISASLAAGERGQWPIDDKKTRQDADREGEPVDNRTMALVTQLTAKAASLEGENKALTEERDYLRTQYETAIERATIAETKLEILTSSSTETAPESQPPPVDDTPGPAIEDTDDQPVDDAETIEDPAPAAAPKLTIVQRIKILFTGKS